MASPVPNNELTRFTSGERAVECGRKGGLAAAETAKKKKTFTNAIKWLANADCDIKVGKIKKTFEENGIDITGLDTTQLATLGLWAGAVYGNAQNYRTLMEGNNETEQLNETPDISINIIDNTTLEKTMYEEEEE